MVLGYLDTAKRVSELVNSDAMKLPEVLDADIQWEIVRGFPMGVITADSNRDFVHIWSVRGSTLKRPRQLADTVQLSRALNHDVPVY